MGLKCRPSIAITGQFETICLPFNVSLQDNPDMIETLGAAVVGGNDSSLNPDDTDDWLDDRLHIGEQYNHAIRHSHVFRQPVLQPHDTIRSSLVGATDRSVVNGIKIPSLYYNRRSV